MAIFKVFRAFLRDDIENIPLKRAPAECRKFERKMADVEKNAQQGESIDFSGNFQYFL